MTGESRNSVIRQNLEEVIRRKRDAAVRAGADPEKILLLAVTKTHSAETLNRAIEEGVTDIGENKVQEILDKYEKVRSVRWHMIGHLQTNKVKYIIDKVDMIHSVDSLRLAEEIDRRCGRLGKSMDILIQINAGGEESKYGIPPEEAETLAAAILDSCPNLKVRGLMCVAPYEEDPEAVRPCFAAAKSAFDRCRAINHPRSDFQYLSMGMSHDFETAIEEGSNLIRVGTALFGERIAVK